MPQRSNHVAGIIVAAGTVYTLFYAISPPSIYLLGAAGLAAYGSGVVLDACVRISVFWYRHGTRGFRTWRCGGCGTRIHWKPRDWVLECKSCGWKPRLPGVRWISHSVPVVQARRRRLLGGAVRTVTAGFLVVGILLMPIGGVAVVESAVIQTIAAVDDGQLDDGVGGQTPPQTTQLIDETVEPTPTITQPPTQTLTPKANRDITVAAVEQEFVRLLNRERQERELGQVRTRTELTQMGISHSRYMLRAGEIGHDGLGDGSIESRFKQRELLPQCRIPLDNGRYYPGAENAGQTWLRETVMNSEAAPSFIDSSDDLARALFVMCMESPPHRRPMMTEGLESVGLGFVSTDSEKIYAALEMCGA